MEAAEEFAWLGSWRSNCLDRGPFINHVDNIRWVGGLKFAIFVHVWYIKIVHEGRWVVIKSKIMSTWFLNDPQG